MGSSKEVDSMEVSIVDGKEVMEEDSDQEEEVKEVV